MTGPGAAHLAAHVLLWAGVACFLVSAAALPFLPPGLARLHALAPAGGLGTPLIACAVALEQGLGRAAGKTLLIGLLLAAGSTVTTIAVARATAEDGGDRADEDGEDEEHAPHVHG
ncbi:monovalent cation/H(+) antiporter subunit G [Streptomyces sp. NPDC127110]|uniref:monovalent cation/H(+) antiporter subunit G n=1 Tax=Streptomyces sp. NPDC127110 TaxID=3345362 RepID=UPI00363434BD